MISPSEIIGKLSEVYREIEEITNLLRRQLSEADLELQKIEHEIEFGSFNVVKGYNYSKRIKEIRIERRHIKDDLQLVEPLYNYVIVKQGDFKKLELLVQKRENGLLSNSLYNSLEIVSDKCKEKLKGVS